MIQQDYLQKVYAGFLGMNVGIRLGAPVEPTIWSYERIERTYGNITGYVKNYKNFAADDDANGPVYFLRALDDEDTSKGLLPKHVANTWLNYAREGVGMFWWGGYGVSTEHTAYLNLLNGIEAPMSGSKEQNGKTVSDQIGGQIFIDTWGLIAPNDPERAAHYAEMAASVSHDGEGLYGARFIAGCISIAFAEKDPKKIIEAGLKLIPSDSKYSEVTRSVMAFHKEHPEDWRKCMKHLHEHWGYDKYPGVCHIIPNAGVCILGLLYGEGDFNRTVEITTMCGWDTDCNAGNVGTIMGVACGLEGIKKEYLEPINDSIVLSGISGYLNILDIPSYSKEIVLHGYKLLNEEIPEDLSESFKEDEINFDFELPGSTHNFRVSNPFYCRIRNTEEKSFSGKRSLEVLFDRMVRGQKCKLFYKPFYRREDFSDERYMPVFSPKVYSGQEVSMKINVERWNGESIFVSTYVRDTLTKEEIILTSKVITEEGWQELSFVIPDLKGSMVDEVGLIIEGNSPAKYKDLGVLYLDDFTIKGKADYTVDVSRQKKEFGSITPFSHNHGAWDIVGEYMECMTVDHAEAMTGNYFTKDLILKGSLIPETGYSHLIGARIQGAMRGYYGGFTGENEVSILLNHYGMKKLVTVEYPWEFGKEYFFEFSLDGDQLQLSINGETVVTAQDSTLKYGMVGYAKYALGRTKFNDLSVKEL